LLLQTLRIQPGQRIGLWLRNRPEFIPALLGALHAGAIVVPINNFLKPEEVAYLLHDAGIDLVISETALAEERAHVKALRPQLHSWEVDDLPGLEFSPESLPIPARNEEDLAA
jgi:acyl-CoA synthetase (AMP-forming)/AMP-acid ligase II